MAHASPVILPMTGEDTSYSYAKNYTNQLSDFNDIKRQIDVVREFIQSIDDGDLSISTYDTAWVALVKDIHGSDAPLFPSTLDWIINNQLPDGSWGDRHFFSPWDRLNGTLACIVALKTWNLCPEGCEKGISFLRDNLHKLQEEDPEHLMVFAFTFPLLLELAQKLELHVFEDSSILQNLRGKRDLHLKRMPKEIMQTVPTRLLYNLEGIPDLDWEKLLKLQHPNGSFLCSPSSTAYALMQTKDEKCFKYLMEIVQKFNGGVPHSHPMDLFERLWVVDRFERLGFSRYFKSEIKEILDYVYRFWTPIGISWSRNTIEMDIDDTSMGFRMLRRHGYNVDANAFRHFEKGGQFFCFVGQTNQGITEMLSLYRASQISFPKEQILEEAKNFSSKFLKEKQVLGQVAADRWLITKDLEGEVKYYLDVPWYASLNRIETRYYIDQYGGDGDLWLAKVLYRMYKVSNNLYLELAKSDYNYCQSLHQLEWTGVQKWYEEHNLKDLGFCEDDLLKSYFIAMSSIFEPEQATERLAWAQTSSLIQLVSLYFKAISVDQKKAFGQAFGNYSNSGGNGLDRTRNEIIEVIHKTLTDISLKVQEVHGMDVYKTLIHAWNAWLLKLKTEGDNYLVPDDEAELLVYTINLCAGRTIPQSEYVHVINVTNEICNYLREAKNIKVGRKKNSTANNLESIDLQMQELVQHVVKHNSGIDLKIKQTFFSVAKGYYYSAYCESTTIDHHIQKVLFERVV